MANLQLASEYIEALTADQSARQVAAEYVEVLTADQATSRLAITYIEVLTPATLLPTAPFVGWGAPL